MMNILLILVSVVLISCSSSNMNQKVTKEVVQIKEHLEQLNSQDDFSGALLIAKNDTIIFQKAYGHANLNFSIHNTIDTKFNIASMGKMFTGISIMQLKERGLLSTTDKVGKFLTEYPNSLVRDSVSIHQLLTHTSGLPDFMTPEYYASAKDKYRTLNDYSHLYQSHELRYTPGTKFAYCNSDYMVLGLIIEKITGQTYDEYIEKNIFQVAGMTNTRNYLNDHITDNLAVGYSRSTIYPDKLMNNLYLGGITGGPAGGGYSTLHDIFNFSKALKSNQFLNKENSEILTTGKVDNNSYAYGFADINTNQHRIIGHSGGHFGVASELRIYEDLNYTVVLLTNRDAEDGFLNMRYYIQKTLAGSTPSIEGYYYTKHLIDSILKNEYSKTSNTVPSKIAIREDMLNVAGYHQLSLKNYPTAIKLFLFMTESFPNSANAYDSLGEAYMKAGDKSNALINYKQSLTLDPSNTNARDMIESLNTK